MAAVSCADAIATLRRPAEQAIAFSPKEDVLATAAGHTVVLWDLNRESLVVDMCKIANRNLTRSEWLANVGPDQPFERLFPHFPIFQN